jgi:hypothetical protein
MPANALKGFVSRNSSMAQLRNGARLGAPA